MTNPAKLDRYRQELILALRLHEVSGERIGEVLAEIDEHTAATGEAADEAFGQPRAYAASVAEAVGAATSGGWTAYTARLLRGSTVGEWVTALAAMVGGYLLAAGLGRAAVGSPGWFGWSPWVFVGGGVVAVATAVTALLRSDGTRGDLVRDPRTGETLGLPGWKLALLLAWPLVAMIVLTVGLHLAVGRTA